jgi:hypothetical protein
MNTYVFVFLVFFGVALLAGVGIWFIIHTIGLEDTVIIVSAAVAFGLGAVAVEFLTERSRS